MYLFRNEFTKTKKVVFLSVLASLCLVAHYFETVFPLPLAIPGIKLGFSNTFLLCSIYFFGFSGGLALLACKIILQGLLFQTPVSFLLSFSGGVLSFLIMYFFIKKIRVFSLVGVSVLGAVFHITGQIIAAFILIGNANIFYYFPFLLISAVLTGIFNGFCAKFIVSFLKRNGGYNG